MATNSTKAGRPPASAKPKRAWGERDGKLLTPEEAGWYLGCTERQVRRLIAERKLARVKVGKLVRVKIDDLDAYIDAQRVPAETG
jgi:excisionase family DNA binding protein